MKITATCGGGVAGQTESLAVDTGCSANGRAIEDMLAVLGAPPALPVGADIAHWNITIDDGGQRRSVAFAEDGSAATRAWQALVATLRASA